jgi:hypothetical protein
MSTSSAVGFMPKGTGSQATGEGNDVGHGISHWRVPHCETWISRIRQRGDRTIESGFAPTNESDEE